MSLPNDPLPPSNLPPAPSAVQPPAPSAPTPRAASRRGLMIGGITAALLVVAWAGSTVYSAGQTEQVSSNLSRTLDTALKANKLGKVERHTFRRGLTESTDDTYIVLGENSDAYRLHLRNHIQNGPLPGLSQVGQAAVDTEIIWDAKTQAALDKAFAGKKPTIHTLIGLGGATDTTLQIPAGQYAADGATSTWQALSGQFQVGSAGRSVHGTMTWPGGTAGSSEGTATLKDMKYTVDQQPYLKRLSQGTSGFSVASIQFPGGVGSLNGLNMTTTTAPSGANLDSRTTLTASSLSAEGQTFNGLKLVLSASGLNSSALEGLAEIAQRPEYQDALKSDDTSTLDATMKKMMADLKPALRTLLAGNPRLAVNEVSVQTPQGPLKLSLGAQVVDGGSIPLDTLMSEDTLKAGADSPALLGLLGNFKLTADIEGNQKAISGLLGSSGDDTAESVAQSIEPMVQEGMITRKGDTLSTHLEFGKDGATINGKPVPLE
ncbi:DUF945 family protein [Deinococcus altitudinis]|uniref:YdgA family protein n=1 Tax=Deinococcus altitudinis TaxID=468914 RepID=UPI0038927CA7